MCLKRTGRKMDMLQLGICDDDRIFLNRAAKCLNDYYQENQVDFKIHFFESAKSLISYIEQPENTLNILFLDIELDEKAAGEDGISAGRIINRIMPGCQIIFITNHNEYSMDVYEVVHRGFIVKSEFEKRFERALEILVEQNRLLTVSDKGKKITYVVSDICYIERGRRICRIVTADSCRDESSVINQLFEEVCGRIEGSNFVRCHNSYMVNLCQVRTYAQEGFLMSNGEFIPISRRYRNTVRDHFLEWQQKWM